MNRGQVTAVKSVHINAEATENAADGITFAFTLEHPPGLKELGQAMVERGAAGGVIADAISKGAAPTMRVEVFAGRRCG